MSREVWAVEIEFFGQEDSYVVDSELDCRKVLLEVLDKESRDLSNIWGVVIRHNGNVVERMQYTNEILSYVLGVRVKQVDSQGYLV